MTLHYDEIDREDEGTVWFHDIFTCHTCGYATANIYTAKVINDLLTACPSCDTELKQDDKTAWCNLRHVNDCGWYDHKEVK